MEIKYKPLYISIARDSGCSGLNDGKSITEVFFRLYILYLRRQRQKEYGKVQFIKNKV